MDFTKHSADEDIAYLKKHNVPTVMEEIVSKMLADLPEKPIPFLVEQFAQHDAYKKEQGGTE